MHTFHTSKRLEDINQNVTESINYWRDKTNYFSKSFALSVFLSSSPILIGLLIMFIISRSLNFIQYYRAKKARINRQEKLKKYEKLYEESAKYMENKNKVIIGNIKINNQNFYHEEEIQKNHSSNIKRKMAHPFGLSELFIPDENKVPIVLLNEALARSSNMDLAQISKLVADDDNNNNNNNNHRNVRFDPEIVDVINELVHPKFNLTDEEESASTLSNSDNKSEKSFTNPISKIANTFKEFMRSDDERQERRNSNEKHQESSAFESSDERRYSKGRRKSSNMKKKTQVSYIQTPHETDDENAVVGNKKKYNRSKYSNENFGNQQKKSSIATIQENNSVKPNKSNIILVVEDYDEINNKTLTKNDESYKQIMSAINKKNDDVDDEKKEGIGRFNEGYDREEV